MRGCLASSGTANSNNAANVDEERFCPVGITTLLHSSDYGVHIIYAVLDVDDVPAAGFHFLVDILSVGQIDTSVAGDLVVVVNYLIVVSKQYSPIRSLGTYSKVSQFEMSSVGESLASHTFLHTRITHSHPDMVAYDLIAGSVVCCRKMLRCHCKTNSVCDTLPEWTGSKLNALMFDLRVAWAQRIRSLGVVRKQLFPGHCFVASEIVVAVLEQTGVPIRQEETIAIEPCRLVWCVLHCVLPQSYTQSCHPNGGSRMSHVKLLAEIRHEDSEALQDQLNIILAGFFACRRCGFVFPFEESVCHVLAILGGRDRFLDLC
jgi:hypothetical protein